MIVLIWTVGLAFGIMPLVAAEQPKFEVASLKPDACGMENSADPGIIALKGYPLKILLTAAFNVKKDQIFGPSWLDSDCFTVNAKIPEGATKDQLPAMFEALLVDRFKLAAHKETRVRSGYALVVDKNGPKLKESDPKSPSDPRHAGLVKFGAGPGTGQIKGSLTMSKLAHFLSVRLDAPVEDLTGLTGAYDVDFSWVPDQAFEKVRPFSLNENATPVGSADADGLSAGKNIFSSIRDSLGLRLESRKVQVEVVVIDNIERRPTVN